MQVCLIWGGRAEKGKQKKGYLRKARDRPEEERIGNPVHACAERSQVPEARIKREATKAGGRKLTKILTIRGSKAVNKIRTYFPDNVSDCASIRSLCMSQLGLNIS